MVLAGLTCFSLCACNQYGDLQDVPAWVVFPDATWRVLTPEEAGIRDVEAWSRWVDEAREEARGASFLGEDHAGMRWGVAITRGGYLVATFGDPEYKYQTASVAKSFVQVCLQLAIDDGLIESGDELIKDYWTGEGQLNSPHKQLDREHHAYLTFNHLVNHMGAFPLTNGHEWKWGDSSSDRIVPAWAKYSGDPDFDNYAHARPGTVAKQYSSGGYWRLAQALTAVWNKDLKTVIDERLFSRMGIGPRDWDWLDGKTVHDGKELYPQMPDYGLFVDPPYRINGNAVRTGGTGVLMSASDLARYGLLVATNGWWKGERLVSRVVNGYGGNGSSARGVSGDIMGSRGDVTTTMAEIDVPWHLFVEPARPDEPLEK